MTAPAPQYFRWDAERSVMVPRSKAYADRSYVDTEEYRLDVSEERSINTHNHEFAWLQTAWESLPENFSDSYPTPEHLRKRALIDCGYFNETIIDCDTEAAAERVAAHLRSKDDFSLIRVRGNLVVEWVAKSQSRRAMKKKEFQESKSALIELISGMIGVSPVELEKQSGPTAVDYMGTL